MKTQEGFTLIELVIVVVIIDILAAIAIPQCQNYVARSKGTSALTTINLLKITVEKSLSRGITGNKVKIDTTTSTATETYIGITPDASKLGVIAVAIENSDADDISFTFQAGTSSPKNTTRAITLSRTANGIWACKSTQGKIFIPKGCTK